MTPPTLAEATHLIHRALDGGITFIDTASAYGRAEEVVGEALQDRRQTAVIATKIGCFDEQGQLLRGDTLRQHMRDSITKSLRLLRTEYIDLLMLHSAPLALLEDGIAFDMLQQFKQQGLARTIGVSTYGNEAPRRAIELGVDALQVAYNILDQRMADEIMPLAQANGVGIIVRSVFLKGALTPRAADLPPHLAPLRQQSELIERYANSLTPTQSRIELALHFVLSQPLVTSVLIGVRTVAELEVALQTADSPPLSPDIMAHLATFRADDPMLLDPSTWNLP
jgi:aryl-alcohol dehydrogenase-like predicted oxidoreductase